MIEGVYKFEVGRSAFELIGLARRVEEEKATMLGMTRREVRESMEALTELLMSSSSYEELLKTVYKTYVGLISYVATTAEEEETLARVMA